MAASNSNSTENSPHIVAVLPRGEAIRNFLYTGALEQLRQQAKVTVVSVLPNQDMRQEMAAVPDNLFELQVAPDPWLVRWLRQELDVIHGRHLWSAAAQHRWKLRDAEAVTLRKKTTRLLAKAFTVPFANRLGIKLFSGLERGVSRALSPSQHYLELWKKLRPTLVFNASHVHSSNAIQPLQAAQWLGIPTATFLFSWDNLTSQGRLLLPYDYFLAWNEDIAETLLEIYPDLRREQVVVTGTPQFDFHLRPEFYEARETFCARVGLDPSRPFILYSTGMDNHMPDEPLIVEGLARMVRELPGRPQLLVRVYPKDRHPERFDEVRKNNPDVFFPVIPWLKEHLTPKYEDCAFLTNTLRHCALGINVASTVSLELAMFDKPIINVCYNLPANQPPKIDYRDFYQFDHYRPLVASGMLRVANSEQEMQHWLNEYLTNPALDQVERKAFIKQMFGDLLDGKSAQRIAATLLKMASN